MNDIPEGCIDKTGDIDIQERITDIVNCEFFIGLSSGLSWLAWALNKPVVMISGFSNPSSEFFTPYRVFNENVCNSCWNDENCKFDRNDWLWCPRNKNFECSKSISPDMVKEKIDMLIANNKY
jgi:autotransporter strand-loop-strand O-heptosyltransferase